MYSSTSMVPDRLFAGTNPTYTAEGVTLLAGSGTLKRGTVLAKITKAIASDHGTNAGNGTISLVTLGKAAKLGVYKITCITKATAAVFNVIEPDGFRLADALAGTAYAGPVNFTLTQGGTVFEVGDSFTVTVSAGSGKCVIVDSSKVDGSQNPYGLLAEDATVPAAADLVSSAYITGEFNENALTFGGTDTAATHKEALKQKGIILRTPVKA